MRALLLAAAVALSSCWVGVSAHDDRDFQYGWCVNSNYPDTRCEQHYTWVNQEYRYRGRWYGGRYVRRHRR